MAATCDPKTLSLNAACFQCISPEHKIDVLIYLACQILLNGGGGGGGGQQFFAANYGGGTPTDTPAHGAGEAVDTSNGRVWLYYSGSWH